MARIEWIHQRLLNWQRWVSVRTSSYATVDLTAPVVDGEGWDAQASIPIDDCEASITDEGVRKLPDPLPDTVAVFYLEAGSAQTRARHLHIQERAMYERIDRAHLLLDSWFAERNRASQAERKRVELLERGMRPAG